jgi:hypothetical protein
MCDILAGQLILLAGSSLYVGVSIYSYASVTDAKRCVRTTQGPNSLDSGPLSNGNRRGEAWSQPPHS